MAMFRSGMPDLRVVIDDMIAEDDKVAVRYTIEGTHEGDLFGIPPTGRRVCIESFTVERVSDGKIREHWRITDSLDMMQQLGAIPDAGACVRRGWPTARFRPFASRSQPHKQGASGRAGCDPIARRI